MRPSRLFRAVGLILAVGFGSLTLPRAPADEPALGTVSVLPVVSVSLTVGGTDKDARRVVYSPPPGWYIRSHRVECGKKYGAVAYSVNTVPPGWSWMSDERVMAASRSSAAAGVSAPKAWVGGRGAVARDVGSIDRQTNSASHHALVVDVSAKGEGLLLGGSGVDLTVYAELVYVGLEPTAQSASAACRGPKMP